MTPEGRALRRLVVETAYRSGKGHIGSALSIIEIIEALFQVMRVARHDDPDRDRLVLSKGHAALALYAALRRRGDLDDAALATYCTDDSLLGVHPDRRLAGVDFSTGSLGLGLSVGAGSALAARLTGSPRRTFVVVSDAELDSGPLWEAVMFAAHHRLGALTIVIDDNGQQAFGFTRDVLDLRPLSPRMQAFGWDAIDVDGHDPLALGAALAAASASGRPRAVVARTVAGRGVSFLEGRIESHYLPLDADGYARAVAEIER